LVDVVNYFPLMSKLLVSKAGQLAAVNVADQVEPDYPVTTFVACMTLFGSAQQVLKNRMQDEAENDLGPLHLRALCLCLRQPGSTQQWLAQAMGRDKAQIARLIRDLEERGFIRRSADARDKRAWQLTLTEAGVEKCQWFLVLEAKLAKDLFTGLGEKECHQLASTMQQLRTRISVEAEK
jgi:DNA-binding MarR family transcriptional regulator